MPKNIMKVNIFEPIDISNEANKKYRGKLKSRPTSYSFHFDTKYLGGSFYIDWEQIPQYIMDKTEIYRKKLSTKILYAPSAGELTDKIKELFKAYVYELSEVVYEKKIGVSFQNYIHNNYGKEELSIGIRYVVFYTKSYINEDGSVGKVINVKTKETHDSEFSTKEYEVYPHTDDLEQSIVGLMQKMHIGMNDFIASMGTKEDIISHFQAHNLITQK